MMPFEGLSDEKDDQLVNFLLEAARSERSDDAMVARVLAAVGIGSAALFGSASLSAQSTPGLTGSTASSGSTGSTGLTDVAGDSLAGPASGTVSSGAGASSTGASSTASNGGAASSSGATTTTTVAAAAPKVGVLGKLVAAAGTSAVKWGAAGTAVVVLGVGMGRSLIGPSSMDEASVAEAQVAASQAQRAASDAPPTEPVEQEVVRAGSLAGAAPAEPTLAPVPETSRATGLAAQSSRAARSAVEPGRHAVRRDSGPVDSALTREVMLVDRARAALAAGATGTTLTTVELYAREFPHGRLLPEAIYLQMEAQVARGDAKQAEQSARRLLAFGKSGIHRARAHKVLEGHLGR